MWRRPGEAQAGTGVGWSRLVKGPRKGLKVPEGSSAVEKLKQGSRGGRAQKEGSSKVPEVLAGCCGLWFFPHLQNARSRVVARDMT